MKTHYEIIAIYDKEYGEVIGYVSDEYMNDSNDIVNHAIKLGLFEEKYRNRVRWARAVSEYEYEYVRGREGEEINSICDNTSKFEKPVFEILNVENEEEN